MTCIIGIKHNNEIYIGGDSLASDGNGFCSIYNEPKVFHKDKFLFGYSGSFRVAQILKYNFDIPYHHPDLSDMQYLVGVFIPSLQIILESNNSVKNTDNGQEMADDCRLIFSYNNSLYCLHSDYQIEENEDNIISIGMGDTIALGAMYALHDKNTEARIIRSLEIVEKLNSSVRAPFIVLKASLTNI